MSGGPRPAVRLANGLLRTAGRFGIRPGSLKPAAIVEQAVARTGQEDFGPDDGWREGLEHLCSDFRGPARLSPIGRIAAHRHLVDLLANRLRLEADRKEHPEIAARTISRPLFIVGLPRTGTTVLHMLLAQDPAHRVPQVWEVMHPAPATGSEKQRKARSARELAWMERLAPDLKVMHPLAPELPQECIAIDSHTLQSQEFQTTHTVANYQHWYEHQPLVPVYRFHRRFLQWLDWQRPGQRWVLKAPAHLFGLDALLEVYPDAAIVQTHRDPLQVMASLASLGTTLRAAFSEHVDPVAVGREKARRWGDGLLAAVRARAAGELPERPFLDISYRDIVADPIATVARIYGHFGLDFSEQAEAGMREFLARNPKDKHGRHRYTLEQFGLDPEHERARFAEYRQRFGC
ncbi:MAG: sulfotransferase family protein [Wenzhouxiangellaceae bacterium]